MSGAIAPTVVLGDVHLTRATPPAVVAGLARLVEASGGARVIVAGDLFDLSAEPGERSGVAEALRAHSDLRRAFGRHVERGGELVLVAGNHDAELGRSSAHPSLAAALDLVGPARARLRTTPWFFRDGALHVEHGHAFDPDNAPAHPLFVGEPSLGVHFTREFIAPTGAHAYLNANDRVPLYLFLSAFRWYGRRAPHVVYRYFRTAFSALLRSGPMYRAAHETTLGEQRLEAFAQQAGIALEACRRARQQHADPTLESFGGTFQRLYLDRVAATLSMAGGLALAAAGSRRAGRGLAAAGAALMVASWATGLDRYGGSVADRLRDGASRLASATGARLVVLGHTHREALEDGYANTGSFAFSRGAPGRPYLVVEGTPERPRAVRRYLVD